MAVLYSGVHFRNMPPLEDNQHSPESLQPSTYLLMLEGARAVLGREPREEEIAALTQRSVEMAKSQANIVNALEDAYFSVCSQTAPVHTAIVRVLAFIADPEMPLENSGIELSSPSEETILRVAARDLAHRVSLTRECVAILLRLRNIDPTDPVHSRSGARLRI